MSKFIYKPPQGGPCAVQDATLGVKFALGVRILDPWYLLGGNKWTRTLFRLKHPIVYSKRGLRNLYRRVKRLFVKDPPMIMCRRFISKEEALKTYPEVNNGIDQKQKKVAQQNKRHIREQTHR